MVLTPNVSTGDGGVHHHQAINSLLLYNTKINHGAFNFTSLKDAILPLPRLFSETAPLQRSSAPPLGWPYKRLAIFLVDNTHAHCAYTSSPQGSRCNAPCRKLSLSSSFTMIILVLLEVCILLVIGLHAISPGL